MPYKMASTVWPFQGHPKSSSNGFREVSEGFQRGFQRGFRVV